MDNEGQNKKDDQISKSQRDLFENQIDKLMSDHPELFPTRAKFWSWLRGCLRRGIWEKSPMKLKLKTETAVPPPEGYTGRGRKGHYCPLINEWSPTSKNEVDHFDGNKPFKGIDDLIPYIVHLMASTDQLQVVNKEAHKIKSYAEREGITYEQAVIQKKVISLCKGKGDAKEWLKSVGIEPESNAKKRRQQVYDYLIQQEEL